jgi:hypothetical protein
MSTHSTSIAEEEEEEEREDNCTHWPCKYQMNIDIDYQ